MYSFFIIKLPLTLFLFCLIVPSIYANDTFDEKVLQQLRQEIEILIRQKNPQPVPVILKRYKVGGGVAFSSVKNESDSQQLARFLPKKRPVKIRLSEWQALKKSNLSIEPGEEGTCEFTLLDLDEDGARDLIVWSFTGGTGLFSNVYVYRQSAGRFAAVESSKSSGELSNGHLYSINGRGAEQDAEWLRINGRVYLAYRNGEYGKDELLLLRAFPAAPKKNKGLVVEYGYRHLLPPLQKLNQQINARNGKELEAGLYVALQKGLERISSQSGQKAEINYGECPVPENLSAEEKELYEWSWFRVWHYTFETVADFPIFVGNQCYAARLVSLKSSYLEGGVYVSAALWLLRQPNAEQEEFDINSTRSVKGVRIAEIEYPFEK
jgi:hypothetical protein